MLRLPEAPLPPAEVDRLVGGQHHDPHALLGTHPVHGGTAIRVLRPFAERVVVETAQGPAELTHQQGGLFTGLLAGAQAGPVDYRLLVTYPGGEPIVQQDGYRARPTLGELDLHLISEGRHEQLWQALGSHVRTVDGVDGTAFAVWAPNAAGVRLIGGFNHWNGTGHPMRSLGSSGIWELFVPGLAEGTEYKYEIHTRQGWVLDKADPLARAAQLRPAPPRWSPPRRTAGRTATGWPAGPAPPTTGHRCRSTSCTCPPGAPTSPPTGPSPRNSRST